VRYAQEHNLHIKSEAISVTGPGGPEVFPVRYAQEHNLHIKSNAISVTGPGGPGVRLL
jgi:hypothetical protein